jgi:hypothetical protein
MSGWKTYLAAGLLAAGAVGSYLTGDTDLAAQLLGLAAVAAGLRDAISKIPVPAE